MSHYEGAYFVYEQDGETIREFEEERALAYLLAKGIVFVSDKWQSSTASYLISLYVDCSDVFAWGFAEGEELPFEEIETLYKYVKNDPKDGSYIWCIIQRKMMPQKPVQDAITQNGIWNLLELQKQYCLAENKYDLCLYDYLKYKQKE